MWANNNARLFHCIRALIQLLLLFHQIDVLKAQKYCNDAPSGALRYICEQLHCWDAHARVSNFAIYQKIIP